MTVSLAFLGRALMCAVLVGMSAGAPMIAAAQDRPAPSEPDRYTFGDMGFNERVLRGPSDAENFVFAMPGGQQIVSGAELQLDIHTFVDANPASADTPPQASAQTTDRPASAAAEALTGSRLFISFNSKRLLTVPLTRTGEQRVSIPISDTALLALGDGRHNLKVTLDARQDCTSNRLVEVALRETSSFVLPAKEVAVPLDLAALPRPLYQGSFLPEAAIIVVPDKPSVAELQAAMTTAAGFGRMTNNQLDLMLRRVSSLTPAETSSNHLILVGKPGALPLLDDITLPLKHADGAWTLNNLGGDDGVVQLAASPWAPSRGVLVVSGNSDAAVAKAAQGVAARQLLVDKNRTYSLIAKVQPEEMVVNELGSYSFADLGYNNRRAEGVGNSTLTYDFMLPEGQALDDDAFVDLQFTHSRLIDYDLSALSVFVNGSGIGSVRLSDETSALNTVRFSIPRSTVHAGRNELSIDANLVPRAACFTGDEVDLWLDVWPDSLLSIPLTAARPATMRSLSLAEYPAPFDQSPDLNNAALVVPVDDPSAWETAAGIAAELGNQTTGALANVALAYGDAVPDELRQTRDLIIIGQSSALPIVSELNAALPAPFEEGSNRAVNRQSRVVFSAAQEREEGYLQLFTAPWNSERIILAILGSNAEAVGWAADALAGSPERTRLGGNFALVVGDQVFIGGNRVVSAPSAAAATATAQESAPVSTEFSNARPPADSVSLVVPLGISVAVMALVIGTIVVVTRRRWLGGEQANKA